MKWYNSKIRPKRIDATARCDRTGLICLHGELVKQMEFAGRGLVWTGLWVSREFVDKPNPSLMTPLLKADPVAVPNPRPWQLPEVPISNQANVPISEENVNNSSTLGGWGQGQTNYD